jgi:Tfp pilus assembly protein PilO
MRDFKQRLILILSISLSIILVLVVLFYYFYNDISKKVVQINIYRQEVVSRATILNRIQSLEQEYTKSLPYFEKLNEALPTETEMVSLEEILQNLASENNLDLSFRFGLLNEETEQEPRNYSFNLILSGEKNGILKWIDGLQKLSYTIRIDQIELTQTNSKGDKSYYSVKILGRIYLR